MTCGGGVRCVAMADTPSWSKPLRGGRARDALQGKVTEEGGVLENRERVW
jgi:hypothetical protein